MRAKQHKLASPMFNSGHLAQARKLDAAIRHQLAIGQVSQGQEIIGEDADGNQYLVTLTVDPHTSQLTGAVVLAIEHIEGLDDSAGGTALVDTSKETQDGKRDETDSTQQPAGQTGGDGTGAGSEGNPGTTEQQNGGSESAVQGTDQGDQGAELTGKPDGEQSGAGDKADADGKQEGGQEGEAPKEQADTKPAKASKASKAGASAPNPFAKK